MHAVTNLHFQDDYSILNHNNITELIRQKLQI